MAVHVEKPGLIPHQDELPAEPFCVLEDFEKFMALPETVNLLRLR
jgi:hypothetical protein